MNLSKAFSIVRQRYGVDSRIIAKHIGVSIRTAQEYMSEKGNPKFATIECICDAIGCTVSELIHEHEIIKGIRK